MDITNIDERSLVSLVERASVALQNAKSSAEILEAKEQAKFAYDAAKISARFQKAKRAHDELIAATHRAQAHALEIEALAKRRLADEYDAAQDRGEIANGRGRRKISILDENTIEQSTVNEIGLTSKQVFEARLVRDAEVENPGVVRQTLDKLLEEGKEPTRAALTNAIVNRTSFTGNNEWHTPTKYIELVRNVLGEIDLDPASNEQAQTRIKAAKYYTEEENGLAQEWNGNVWLNPPYAQPAISDFINKMVDEIDARRVKSAIMLTHNYTDTAWFQKAALQATAICFTKGRVKFEGPNGEIAAPTQGQAFFYFGDDMQTFCDFFDEVGFIVEVKG